MPSRTAVSVSPTRPDPETTGTPVAGVFSTGTPAALLSGPSRVNPASTKLTSTLIRLPTSAATSV